MWVISDCFIFGVLTGMVLIVVVVIVGLPFIMKEAGKEMGYDKTYKVLEDCVKYCENSEEKSVYLKQEETINKE